MAREALKSGRQTEHQLLAKVMRQTGGELTATQAARFFLAARRTRFEVEAWRREKCRCHGLAEKFPRICHAAVRLNSYAAFERGRVGWAEPPDANASDGVPTIRPCIGTSSRWMVKRNVREADH